ncbi:MAG: DUF6345 domain-containing protein [Gemmataceae bacterium]
MSLPIYELRVPKQQETMLQQVTSSCLKLKGKPKKVGQDRLRIMDGKKVSEIWRQSGGISVADYSQLWNPKKECARPNKELLERRLAELGKVIGSLSKGNNDDVKVEFKRSKPAPSTIVMKYDVRNKTNTKVRELDLQWTCSPKITVRTKGRQVKQYSLFGGGGEFTCTLGSQGDVIGMCGVWRPIGKLKQYAKVVSEEEADRRYYAILKKDGIRRGKIKLKIERTLGYYSAPAAVRQRYLYPVYAYQAVARIGEQKVPLQIVLVPATDFGVETPQRRTTERSMSCNPELPVDAAKRNCVFAADDDGKLEVGAVAATAAENPNVKGFLREAKKICWKTNFDVFGTQAKLAHWTTKNADFVDACDLVFYTGHAYSGGWYVDTTGFVKVRRTDAKDNVDVRKDLWGNDDLEWLVIAACGPLHDKSISPPFIIPDHAAERWADAFDGLHQLLGYASVTYAADHLEGKLFLQYCTQPNPLTTIQAWLQAAADSQDSMTPGGEPIWAGCLYAEQNGKSTVNDHLWGHGPTAKDPKDPDNIYLILSRT